LSIVLLTIGLCNVVLFNGRSSSHAYYYFLLSLAVGLVLVNALRLLAQGLAKWTGRTPLSVGLASATIVGCLFVGLWTNWAVKLQQEAPGVRQLARQIDGQVPAGHAILCHPESLLDAVLYSKRRWLPPLPSVPFLRGILERMDGKREVFQGVMVVMDAATASAAPDYADELKRLAETRKGARMLTLPFGTVFIL
jgi:hypothetical protein